MKSLLASAGAAAVREAFGSVHPVSSGRPALDLLGIEDDVEAERLQLRERTLRRLGPVCMAAGFMAALSFGFRLARGSTPQRPPWAVRRCSPVDPGSGCGGAAEVHRR